MGNNYIFIRHGSTDYNVEKKIMGTTQVPLNEHGIEDALTLKSEVSGLKIDIIYSSPLVRSIETANILALKPSIIIDERLCERCYGELQGFPKDTYFEVFPEYKNKNILKDFFERPKGGETIQEVFNRVINFLTEIDQRYTDKNILIVTHNGVLRAVNHFFLNTPLIEVLNMKFPHCKIITYRT